jgi:hypothetical protein
MPNKGEFIKGKVCPRCKRYKLREAFIGNRKDRAPYDLCLPCCAIRAREYRKANPKKIKSQKFKHRLKYQFGITPEIYNDLLLKQSGVCAICNKSPNGKLLAVDHDHTTGKVRGLLCNDCNLGLGQLGDTTEAIEKVLNYLYEKKN